MERYTYDLHMHSCLSPCGDEDMTPNNLVNMGAMLGCDILAITDHNSCKNAPAAMEVGERAGILVVPGMELCTSEDAHVVCLFDSLAGAMAFDAYIHDRMPPIQNRPEIFGRQVIRNGEDEEVGIEDLLLISATAISADEVVSLVAEYGGAAFPAHVNKDSYSLIASLGVLPTEAGFHAMELTEGCDTAAFAALHPETAGLAVVRDSDAHYLESIRENPSAVLLLEKSLSALIQAIREGNPGCFL